MSLPFPATPVPVYYVSVSSASDRNGIYYQSNLNPAPPQGASLSWIVGAVKIK